MSLSQKYTTTEIKQAMQSARTYPAGHIKSDVTITGHQKDIDYICEHNLPKEITFRSDTLINCLQEHQKKNGGRFPIFVTTSIGLVLVQGCEVDEHGDFVLELIPEG